MITQEHLEHWLREIHYQTNGILEEINEKKVSFTGGMSVGENGKAYVSFVYLREKADLIKKLLKNIESDIEHDT